MRTNIAALNDAARTMLASGHKICQVHRLADDDLEHVRRLSRWADLPRNATVVDMGSGIGEVARLWHLGRPDLAFNLVNISRFQLDCLPDWGAKKHCCDMTDVPEPDNTFDAAVCCFAIGHVDKPGDAFKEMARLVKPGGIVFVYDMIRLRGDNRAMAELGYTVGPRGCLDDAAQANGLDLDVYMEPTPVPGFGESVLGADYEKYFAGVAPAIWRFIVR
jgi:ubiquinone/menaquinone biosynthesis C-methylase UbiE